MFIVGGFSTYGKVNSIAHQTEVFKSTPFTSNKELIAQGDYFY